MKKYILQLRTALLFTIGMLVICGVLYPLALSGVSQLFFHDKANGSKLEIHGKAVASANVGQDFHDPRLFHSRPSAVNYNTYTPREKANGEYSGLASGSNNYASSNPKLKQRIADDIASFQKANPTVQKKDIPSDLITASASGLDPDISVQAATVQIDRIAKATGLSKETLKTMIQHNTKNKFLGVFGEPTINVVKLNIELAKAIGML